MSGQPDPEPTSAYGSDAASAKAEAAGAAHKAPPRSKARAKAAGSSVGDESVTAAAQELAATTSFVPQERHPPASLVSGALPPLPSSTNRRYYAFRPLPSTGGRPLIAAGQRVAVNELGGSWLINAYGRSPQG